MRKLSLLALVGLMVGVAVAPADAGKRNRAPIGARVKAVDFDFIPKRVRVRRGERVIWANREGRHTVTFRRDRRGRQFNKTISGDDRIARRFRRPGRYNYVCRFHRAQGMKGRVVVRRGRRG